MTMIKTTNRIALRALAVGRTRSGGSVQTAVQTVLRTPPGGWSETVQARRQLEDAVFAAHPRPVRGASLETACDSLVTGALEAGWPHHCDRS